MLFKYQCLYFSLFAHFLFYFILFLSSKVQNVSGIGSELFFLMNFGHFTLGCLYVLTLNTYNTMY